MSIATTTAENHHAAGARTPTRASILPAVMRSEATKLRSVRSTMWSLVATFGLTVGLGALFCFAFVNRYDQLGLAEKLAFDPTSESLQGLFLAQIAIGVLGVLVISSEYATGLVRTTFGTVPQRRSVLAAKAIVFGAVALVVGTVSSFVAFFVGQAVLTSKHIGVSITDANVLRAVVGTGVYLTMVGLLGLAIGTVVRRTAGAIATLFGFVLVAPLLARALPSPWNNDISKYLPSGIGQALRAVQPDPTLLSPGIAVIVMLAWLVAAFAGATFLISRRDA